LFYLTEAVFQELSASFVTEALCEIKHGGNKLQHKENYHTPTFTAQQDHMLHILMYAKNTDQLYCSRSKK
jgi:hypothetical protein